ncbi:F-box domain-containing protein [Plectosphaerella cucumerina]|uniref:F-box domain-containing protein n=1 Tax=Plectosphaerella cucumerina TaxID=40658 RepID=A0A8K0X2U7_9PEZI|nr:F-box domain-containing protein [Plectosphaerella cucumerina]
MKLAFRKMGLFNFRRKDKKKDQALGLPGKHDPFGSGGQNGHQRNFSQLYSPTFASADMLLNLPGPLIERIFSFVCPHTQDESYETCEQSAPENSCMLCDLRDLAHCAQVCKKWRNSARKVMYHSIRIDSVHYCDREAFLAEARKRRTRFDRNGEPEDTPSARLKLLCRTLRDDPTRLGANVRFFKTPYMLREAAQADLARTIAVLPNLLYVDLPEGLFSDDPHYATLRLEVEARCPNLQKMTYRGGSERSLSKLAYGSVWPNLQVLELIKVNMDPAVLRQTLGALRQLHALKVTDSKAFSDEVFAYNEMLPPFPPLEQLVLTRTPNVTSAGLVDYLAQPEARTALKVLSLNKTGVDIPKVHEVLSSATSLKTLVVQQKVSLPFKSGPQTQRMTSNSLETLRFEVTSDSQASPYSGITKTYYTYLASSILANGLRNLRAVYVIDEDFAEQLQGLPSPPPRAPFSQNGRPSSSGAGLSSPPKGGYMSAQGTGLQPPVRPFATGAAASNRFSSNNPFAGTGSLTHTLEIFAKKDEAMNWSFVKVSPTAKLSPQNTSRYSMAPVGGDRPVSAYGLGADMVGQGWNTAGARRSIMVGNGVGGFMALPQDVPPIPKDHPELWARPVSSASSRKGDRDMWR